MRVVALYTVAEGSHQPFESVLMTHIATVSPLAPHSETFLNSRAVVQLLPMGRSTWLLGVKAGKYPQPVRFSSKRPVWKRSDIDALLASV